MHSGGFGSSFMTTCIKSSITFIRIFAKNFNILESVKNCSLFVIEENNFNAFVLTNSRFYFCIIQQFSRIEI